MKILKTCGLPLLFNQDLQTLNYQSVTYYLSKKLSFDNFGTQIQISKSFTPGNISNFNGTLSFTKNKCTYTPTNYIRSDICKVATKPVRANVYVDATYTASVESVLTSISDLFRNQFNNLTFDWIRMKSTMNMCENDETISDIHRSFNKITNNNSSIDVLFINCTIKDINGISNQGGYNQTQRKGIVVQANRNIIGTLAHELGHMFNMSHESDGIMQINGTRIVNGTRQFNFNSVDKLCKLLYMKK
jgi:hypothetical protein